MKSLKDYIFEKSEEDKEKSKKDDIKFTIWKSPKNKVNWIEDNEPFQKIEYQYEDKKKGISIDFLLGIHNEVWGLWCGKVGATSYDDDPYCSFDTQSFSEAIINALDKIDELIKEVEDNPDNWIQYYTNI